MMTTGINLTALIILLAVVTILVGTPIFVLVLGVTRFKRTRSAGSRITIGIGTALCLMPVAAVISFVVWVGPGRSGVLAQGSSPEGLEYCVVQTYKNLAEPYQVSFYIRDTNGIWSWNYLEHEDIAWRSAQVKFVGNKAIVSRNRNPFREIPIPTGPVDIASVPGGHRDHYCAAEFSVQDVLEFHNARHK